MNPTEVFSFTDGLRIDGETVWLEQSPFTTKVDVTTHPIQSTQPGVQFLSVGKSRNRCCNRFALRW